MLRNGLKGPLWIMLLALAFWALDQLRGGLNLNLGWFPQALKILYVRVLSYQLGYPDQGGTPEAAWQMNRAARRRAYYGVPQRLRQAYYGWYIGAKWGRAVPAGGATIQGTRSGLLWKHTPGGLPIIQNAQHFSGNVFFVDANAAQTGTTSGFGTHPDKAIADLDSARALCTANQGDAIFVLPGHTENIAAAADINLSVAGVSVIGLGRGNARPTFTFATDTAADLEIDAASVLVQNLRFIGNIAALAAAIDVDAAAFMLEDCDFYVATATTDVDITIITDANADDMVVRRCRFYYDYSRAATAVTAASTEVIRLVGADRAVIEHCYFAGNFSTSIINGITTLSGDIYIGHNRMYNDQTGNVAGWIDLVAGCTGVIEHHRGFHGYTTDIATVIDPASCAMIENYASNVVTEAGGIIGTRST